MSILFSGRSGIRLDWMRRLRIALGAARGLQYLHDLADPPIIHRDIKSNNILLDERLNAKVADFGLSKPMGETDRGHVTTQVKGTMVSKYFAHLKSLKGCFAVYEECCCFLNYFLYTCTHTHTYIYVYICLEH